MPSKVYQWAAKKPMWILFHIGFLFALKTAAAEIVDELRVEGTHIKIGYVLTGKVDDIAMGDTPGPLGAEKGIFFAPGKGGLSNQPIIFSIKVLYIAVGEIQGELAFLRPLHYRANTLGEDPLRECKHFIPLRAGIGGQICNRRQEIGSFITQSGERYIVCCGNLILNISGDGAQKLEAT